jgi:Astacin (Peptidase family M12A)
MAELIVCRPRTLPREKWVRAAQVATDINPVNHPPIERMAMVMRGFRPDKERLAVLTTKFWHGAGVLLTVGFLDNPPPDLRARILLHMNAWSKTANAQFVEANTDPEVRIARAEGDGHWSNLGTDILTIDRSEPTMNLEAFTMSTPESEFHRVVRHETGHTLGFPHEHMRKELVAKIDPEKAIKFYAKDQGWNAAMVREQVLKPIEEGSLLGTSHPDPNSIMCYQIPGTITKDGQPIPGGLDIDELDYEFAAKVYPKSGSSVVSGRTRNR